MLDALLLSLALVAAATPAGRTHRTHRAAPQDVIHRIVINGRPGPRSGPAADTGAGGARQAANAGPGGTASAGAQAAKAAPGDGQQQQVQVGDRARAAQAAIEREQLEAELAAQQQELERERARTAALEQQAAEERARWQLQVEQPVRRAQALGVEVNQLSIIGQELAAGSIDMGPAIAQARAGLAFASINASGGGSEGEAIDSSAASYWLAVSEDAMQRSDLYEARLAVNAAAGEAQRARALADATASAATRY